MPLVQSSQDHLPFIDTTLDATPARALITAELPPDHKSIPHPSLPSFREPHFSEAVSTAHSALASGAANEPGIDLSRYEVPSAPESNDVAEWRAALRQAYASSEYLSSRLTNLGLLETYGKNAWLIGNSQLEDILKVLEQEVSKAKTEVEEVEAARRRAQEGVKGEMEGLEQAWRTGVGRMIEVEVASEGLRREILERRRAAAS